MSDFFANKSLQPLLTVQEEIECGRRIQAWMPYKDLPEDQLTPAQRRLAKRGLRARDRMVNGNLRLVTSVARKTMPFHRHLSFHDICQEGAIGLLRAAEKFDPTRGYKFSTYAYWWIRQAINRAASDQDRTIRLPSNMVEKVTKANRLAADMLKLEGTRPTVSELADAVGCEEKLFRAALVHYYGCTSTDILTACETPLMDILPDPKSYDVEAIAVRDDVVHLMNCLSSMEDHQRSVIEQYYGLGDSEKHSLTQISKREGVSREAIRQRMLRAQLALKKRVGCVSGSA
jgi:RNA polymerase nonessential primary-like sigma factor